ncbi:MAG: hypothetical protein Q4E76_05905 [Tissierellia bacterium]|nr:hypothetical protein [Tissierellia bacterium]
MFRKVQWKGRKRISSFKGALALLPLCLFLVACQGQGPGEAGSGEVAQTGEASSGEVAQTGEESYPILSLEELSQYAHLIVAANFKESGGAFKVLPHGGDVPAVFTDRVFEITKVYKGDRQRGDEVILRTQGGDLEGEEDGPLLDRNSEELNFEDGGEVLLFLARPTTDPYKTREDYYQLVGGPNGAYTFSSGILKNLADPSMTLEEGELADIDPTVDPRGLERARMEEALKAGAMSQEEYDDYFERLEQYGERQ